MDDTEYRKKLSEVADWEIPKLTKTDIILAEKAKRPKGRPTNEELYQEEHEEVFLDLFNGINPTHPPEILKLKSRACVCDDCGNHCPDGRKKEKKLYETGSKKNWRERCLTCERSKNPFTGKFDLTFSEASYVWTDYLKDRKGSYQTEKNKARQLINTQSTESQTVIESGADVITFYHNTKDPDK